ncbi:MAG: hypothetical protein ACRDAM_07805, partial [Casimicrobium sp.]
MNADTAPIVSNAEADWLTPAAQMPWPVSTPFRMRPNLEKLDPESPALLLRDEQFDAYQRLRNEVFASRAERACVGEPDEQTVIAIANRAHSVGAALPRTALPLADADRGRAA